MPCRTASPSLDASILDLGAQFVAAARRGNAQRLVALINQGVPVNYRNSTGMTALHAAAASGARKAVRALTNTTQCDFLIRDSEGRLPSELAYLYGKDVAMARLLASKEARQARQHGVVVGRRPQR
jgi:ankyrin repeat protein